jgi:deoxyribonuclease-4
MELLFGTAGVPISSKYRSTEFGIKRIKELNLECMEVEFVRGVKMSKDNAKIVREVARREKVGLTVHAPYFINLNSKDKEKLEASKQRIIESAQIGAILGAKSVTFHPGYYGDASPKEAYNKVKDALIEITEKIRELRINISPETTGKLSQFGSLEEILSLSEEVQDVTPCIDFAHICAREGGKYNSYKEFMTILDKIEEKMGKTILKELHMHISGIEYGDKGEKRHLTVKDKNSMFNYKELLRALYDREIGGFLVCESPTLEEDAIILKAYYNSLK